MNNLIALDPFAARQFDSNSTSNCYLGNINPQEFVNSINQLFREQEFELSDGYASFCKHLFIPNFLNVESSYLKITIENKHLLKSEYQQRTIGELPVLIQYFSKDDLATNNINISIASYLDIILYHRDQIILENNTRKINNEYIINNNTAIWWIVSIKPQLCATELPMQPITHFRNGLGGIEGGSGVPINREQYMKSIQFWSTHASVK